MSWQTNVTIGNTVPSVTNLAITLSGFKTGGDLSATYDYFNLDDDGESNFYIRWFRNSVEIPDFENPTIIPAIGA